MIDRNTRKGGQLIFFFFFQKIPFLPSIISNDDVLSWFDAIVIVTKCLTFELSSPRVIEYLLNFDRNMFRYSVFNLDSSIIQILVELSLCEYIRMQPKRNSCYFDYSDTRSLGYS